MTVLPQSLTEAIAQARTATQAALADGFTRLQVELVFPELKIMPIAADFLTLFEPFDTPVKVFFPDVGAAALARRDWASEQSLGPSSDPSSGPSSNLPFEITDIGTSRSPVDRHVHPDDHIFLVLEPSAVEVVQVERLCQLAGDRPVILLNPRLEDAATVGIGYAGRQLRERFLNTLESCYYLRPLEQGVLLRNYPSPWQVWRVYEEDSDNSSSTPNPEELLLETTQKPTSETLENAFIETVATATLDSETSLSPSTPSPSRRRPGLLAQLDRFLRALSQ